MSSLSGGSIHDMDRPPVVETRDRPGHPVTLEMRHSGDSVEPHPIRCRICGDSLDALKGTGGLAYHLGSSDECREAIHGWLTDRREARLSPNGGDGGAE
jgi:hypothetical protein